MIITTLSGLCSALANNQNGVKKHGEAARFTPHFVQWTYTIRSNESISSFMVAGNIFHIYSIFALNSCK